MVSGVNNMSDTSDKIDIIEQIEDCIKNKEHFLLSGGAGCGKTYTLVETIKHILETEPDAKIACITYTNAATDEIKRRVDAENHVDNLRVSTIHDFLWNSIKNYKIEIRQAIIDLIKNGEMKTKSFEVQAVDEVYKNISANDVSYRYWRSLSEGIISHNEVIKIAHYMYQKFTMLCSIMVSKYDFILIDEYQDTFQEVVEIFLESLHNYQEDKTKKIVFGFYGDSMQNIYDKGCGNIKSYIDKNIIKEIQKQDNFRSAPEIIEVINNIRKESGDKLEQKPKGENANKSGSVTVFYNKDLDNIKEELQNKGWNFNDYEKTKELYLTHRLIAKRNGFSELWKIYEDSLVDDEKLDIMIKFLYTIENCILYYKNGNIHELLKLIYQIDNNGKYELKISSKQGIHNALEELKDKSINCCVEDVVEYVKNNEYLKNIISDDVNKIINQQQDVAKENIEQNDDTENDLVSSYTNYNKIRSLSFLQIKRVFKYKNQGSIYSTQHSVKGKEFDNVLVIIDNGRNPSKYNFMNYFNDDKISEDIKRNTLNILYVACSRAKINLVIYIADHPTATRGDKLISLTANGKNNVQKIFCVDKLH